MPRSTCPVCKRTLREPSRCHHCGADSHDMYSARLADDNADLRMRNAATIGRQAARLIKAADEAEQRSALYYAKAASALSSRERELFCSIARTEAARADADAWDARQLAHQAAHEAHAAGF